MMYTVITEESLSDLEDRVNRNIQNGWVLQGGLACSERGYYQAMTKK